MTSADLPVVGAGLVVGKSVLVRADLEADSVTDPRFVAISKLVDWLRRERAGAIKVIGHQGNVWQVAALGVTVNYDLRLDSREEANSVELATELAAGFDVYINEAFGTSHRRHTSIDALPRWMKSQGRQVYCGPRFAREVKVLSGVRSWESGVRKVLVIGGVKKDKEKYAEDLEGQGWIILRGGLLTGADLRSDKLDISDESISNFKSQISNSGVIVTAGVMGKYEEVESEYGTREILRAIAQSSAHKVAGGGDVEAAIAKYKLTNKFDWISVGGGAMLEFLATGTLPGIEALI